MRDSIAIHLWAGCVALVAEEVHSGTEIDQDEMLRSIDANPALLHAAARSIRASIDPRRDPLRQYSGRLCTWECTSSRT